MNKQDKNWLISKIDILNEISKGITNAIKYNNSFISKSMSLYLDIFIKQIKEKCYVCVYCNYPIRDEFNSFCPNCKKSYPKIHYKNIEVM